jgi:hypothetical protein
MLSQLFTLISTLKKIASLVQSFFAWRFRRKLEKRVEETKEATKHYSEANIIADDQLRLAAKAKAAHELEESLRPH